MTIILIVISAFATVTKGLLKGNGELGLLITARILRAVLETWGDLLSLKPQWKPSSKTDMKNSYRVNNNNNNL